MEDSEVVPAAPGLTNTQIGGQNTINFTPQPPAFDFRAIPWQMIRPGVSLTFVLKCDCSRQTTMVSPGEVDPGSCGGDKHHQNVSRKRKNRKSGGRNDDIQVRKSRRLESRYKL